MSLRNRTKAALIIISFCTIGGVICLPGYTMADPLDTWQWRNPLPQGNYLYHVAYGNGTFVAVGEAGTVLTSVDGENWTQEYSGTDLGLAGVTYANNLFIAVGD